MREPILLVIGVAALLAAAAAPAAAAPVDDGNGTDMDCTFIEWCDDESAPTDDIGFGEDSNFGLGNITDVGDDGLLGDPGPANDTGPTFGNESEIGFGDDFGFDDDFGIGNITGPDDDSGLDNVTGPDLGGDDDFGIGNLTFPDLGDTDFADEPESPYAAADPGDLVEVSVGYANASGREAALDALVNVTDEPPWDTIRGYAVKEDAEALKDRADIRYVEDPNREIDITLDTSTAPSFDFEF